MAPLSSDGGRVVRLHAAPEVRLRVALRNLDSALAEQRAAVAGWRGSLRDLGTSVSGLQDGLKACISGLEGVQAGLAEAREAALRLDRTADAMASAARG